MLEYWNAGRSFGCFDLNPIIPPFQYSSWVAGSARVRGGVVGTDPRAVRRAMRMRPYPCDEPETCNV